VWDFWRVKLQIIAPVAGKNWPIGHTVLVEKNRGCDLIDKGVAILHPTETAGPVRPCDCKDKLKDEPCEDCEKKKAAKKPARKRVQKKPTPILTEKQ